MSDPGSVEGEASAGPGPGRPNSVPSLGLLARRLVSGAIWAFVGKVITAGSGAATAVLLSRLLSPEELGAYFLALTVVSAASIVGRAGLEKTILQLLAEGLARGEEDRARSVIGRVYGITAIATALVGLTLAVGLGDWIAATIFDSHPLLRISQYLAPWMALLSFELLLAETFRGFDDIPKASIFGGALSRMIFVAILSAILLLRGYSNLQLIILLMLACYALSLAVGSTALWKRVHRFANGKRRTVELHRLIATSSPLLIVNITAFVMTQAGLWILGAFRADEDVAIYGVCVRLVMLVGVSLTIVAAVLPPIIGELYVKGQREKLERVIRTTAAVAAIPSVLALGSFIIAGDRILDIAFGPFYAAGWGALALLSVGQIVNVWAGACGYTLVMTGHQRDLMFSTVVSGLVTIVGSLMAVQPFGILGVAAATAAGTLLNQLLMLAYARIRCGIWTHASVSLLINEAMVLGRQAMSGRRS